MSPDTIIDIDALTGMLPEEIALTLQQPAMRGKQIFQWLHKKQVFDVDQMTDLPEALRTVIKDGVAVSTLTIADRQFSHQAGTVKLLFALSDGATIEAVLLRQGEHVTFCLSTQVGCA